MAKVFLTHGYFLNEDPKEAKIMRPYPPLGLLYISAHLKRSGLDTFIFDTTFSSYSDLCDQLLVQKPMVLALYTNLMTKINVLKIMRFAKENLPNTKLVLGGPDVTYNLENYLRHGADFCVIGEGEQSMEELANYLIHKNIEPDNICGIAFLKAENVHKTPARTHLKDLTELAMPDRESIPMEKYLQVWQEYHGKRTANISTQRGCPYTCKWCSTAVYGQTYRRRSPVAVANEIEELKEMYAVEALWFVDDVFTVSHKWLAELHGEFKRRNLKIDFECISRAERLNDEVLLQLREMGCFRIWIGAESGSQKIIDRMDRRVDIEVVKKMIQRTQEMGMESGTFIMVGYPGETLEDIKLTAQYIKEAKPNLLTITKTYPIKGTSLYNEIEKIITRQPDWATSTDRDIEFQLPKSDFFYRMAIRFLLNEYESAKATSWSQKWKHLTKAKMANLLLVLGR